MDFQILTVPERGLSAVAADALVLILPAEGAALTGDAALDAAVAAAIKAHDFERQAGRTLYLHGVAGVKAPRVVLAGAKDAALKSWRNALGDACQALQGRAVRHLALALAGHALDEAHAETAVLALQDASYIYSHTKRSAKDAAAGQPLDKVSLLCSASQREVLKRGLARGRAIAAGIALARECANRPGNHCTPDWLGDEAMRLGKAHGLNVRVLERKAIEKIGMGAFLSVSQGSEAPPRFIIAEYQGTSAKQAPIVLVGKGITFDSGGISLKPGADMDQMKFDMSGAASVLGTLRALAELKPKINVVGLIPACENMPSGRATKPGDVVASLSGQTIEILNTDAEGRLILCDALTYAERYKPAAVVDIATLTGACVIALGHHHAGLYSTDERLAGELLAASRAALDPCWRMPLDEEYEAALKSNFADLANVGPRAGGSITAAKFLQHFAGAYPWAHLDIAGVSHKEGAAKGATGRPVALLTHFVLGRAK